MATVGAGSPIQTIQYQAMPFQTMAYAPQILSQKHEELQNQLDTFGSAIPSNIPEDAQQDVQAYTSNVDNIVNDLTKSGYSFDMRNRLSGVRKDYIEKIKPIEAYNTKKAELDQLLNKASLNPDLIPMYNMPSYTDFRNGQTNFDFNVVSKSEYAKYGLAMAEQSSQPYITRKGGFDIVGKRDRFYNSDGTPMTGEEIKSAIMSSTSPEDMALKKKLFADGFTDPNKSGANQAINAVINGIMSYRDTAQFSRVPQADSSSSNKSGSGNIMGNLTLTGLGTHSMKEQLGVDNWGQVEAIRSNPNSNPQEKALADKAYNAAINSLPEKDKKSYENVINSRPSISNKVKDNLKELGYSKDVIDNLEEIWPSIMQEYLDRNSTGEILTDSYTFLANRLEASLGKNIITSQGPSNPSMSTRGSKWLMPEIGGTAVGSPGVGSSKIILDSNYEGIVKSLENTMSDYTNWYDNKFKPISEKLMSTMSDRSETPEYSIIKSTARNQVADISRDMLSSEFGGKNPVLDIDRVEVLNKKGDYESVGGNKRSRKDLGNMLANGEIKSVQLLEAGEDVRPGVQITFDYDDKTYKTVLGFNDALSLDKVEGLLRASEDITDKGISPLGAQFLNNTRNYLLTKQFDKSKDHRIPISYIGKELGVSSNMKMSGDTEDLLDGSIVRNAYNQYVISTSNPSINNAIPPQDKLIDLYRIIGQYIQSDIILKNQPSSLKL